MNGHLTYVEFEYLPNLDTVFSSRLYFWLKEAQNKKINKLNEDTSYVELDIDWMLEQAKVKGEYERWDNFKARVLTPALDKINKNTDITVTTDYIKSGKKISTIGFKFISQKAKVTKPIRPTLLKRPRVLKNSHAEREWIQSNFNALRAYRTALKTYDKTSELTLPDLKKFNQYAAYLGYKEIADMLKKEIDERTPAKPKPEIIVTFDNIEEHKNTIIDIALNALSSHEMTDREKAAFDLISPDHIKEIFRNAIDNAVAEEKKKITD